MPTRNWSFDFADVEITEDTIIVNSTIDYKKFKKKFETELEQTTKSANEILENVVQKKRVKEESVFEPERTELIIFFDRLGGQASYEPGEAVHIPGVAEAVRDTAESDIKYEEESLFKIHINEEMDLVLEHDGTLVKSDISGKIKVENKGESDRIWDIDVQLDDVENTDIDEEKAHIHLPRLESNEDWDREYKIKSEQVRKPPLEITEKINTWPDTDEENTTLLLEKEHEVEFTLILENNSDGMILNIDLMKNFPDQFKKLKKVAVDDGDVGLDDDLVEWKIEQLRPGSQLKLKLKADILPESTEPIPTGKIVANYFLSEGTFSGINVQKADGFSKNIFTIDKDERDDEPDVWDCKFVFMNKSEFPFLLEYIRIISGDVDTEQETVRFDPKVIVPPNSVWESESWDLESDDVPTFGKEVLFTLFPDVDEELRAQIEIMPMELYVLSFKGEKAYDKTELPSYKSIPVKATNKVWSEGPVDVESFIFEDVIPEDFRPPLPEHIKLFVNKKEIDPDRYTIDISPSPNYDADSYPDEHKLTITMENLQELVEERAELKARVEYEMTSVQAKPEREYKSDGLFKAYPVARGPEIDVELIPDPIAVTHIRRKETATKSIYPGRTEDEYEIVLTYKNRGNSTMAEKVLVDQVPAQFEILEMDPEAETTEHEDVTRLTWTFKNIEPEQEVSATYLINGKGDYKAGQTEIFTMD